MTSSSRRIPDDIVDRARASDIVEVAKRLGAANVRMDGSKTRWVAGCPKCGGDDRLVLSRRNGADDFFCRNCDQGGGAIQLAMLARGEQFHEAVEFLTGAGIPRPLVVAKTEPRKPKVLTPPPGADFRVEAERCFKQKPNDLFVYGDANGSALFAIARLNRSTFNATGKAEKDFKPLVWTDRGWRSMGWSEPLPLFNLTELVARPDAPVIFVEGEAKARALKSLFPEYVAVTTCGGSARAAGSDLRPLANRSVLIWPDADEAGAKYVRSLEDLLEPLGCEISVVDAQALAQLTPDDGTQRKPPGKGWDAIDALGEWTDHDALKRSVLSLAAPLERQTEPQEGERAVNDIEDGAGFEGDDAPLDGGIVQGVDVGNALEALRNGDMTPFVELAAADAGFPFEREAIAALNRLALSDFERLRARLKADNQVRLAALEDAMKAAAGRTARSDGLPSRPITFDEIKPWPDPVDGTALLTEIAETIGKYVIMDPHQRDAAALGAVFAHTHDLRDTAPIFFIVSPTKRCGKTRLERVIKRLVPKPLMASSATPAFLARAIEKHRPTVLIDEYDATAAGDQAMAETLRGQLNSSFDRDGAKVGKCVPLPGGGYDEREFSTWTPTWIAGIKKIPETVEDRSVVLRLKRKLPGERVARFRVKDGSELDILKRKIARFVVDNEQRLRDIEPDMPEALSAAGDRAPDAWEPLVAIADVAGGAWPERARNAALALAGVDATPLDGDVDAALLSDINHILDACDAFGPTAEQLKSNKQIAVEALEAFRRGEDGGKLRSRHIVGLGGEQLTNALATFVERKWPAWDRGKPMRPHQLARLLSAYGVRSQSLRDGEMVFRGYPRDRLEDVIERYITRSPLISGDIARYSVTRPEKPREIELFENVTNEARNAPENAGNANKPKCRDVVTPKRSGDEGGEVEEAANPLSGSFDKQRRPRRLKLFAAGIEAVPRPELDAPLRLTRTIL